MLQKNTVFAVLLGVIAAGAFSFAEAKVTRTGEFVKPNEFIMVDDNEKALPIETPEGGNALSGLWTWIGLLVFAAGIWWHKKKQTHSITTNAQH